MTIQQLSQRTGLTKDTIKGIENGWPVFANVGIRTLYRIAAGLDCKLVIGVKKRPSLKEWEHLVECPDVQTLPRPTDRRMARHHTLRARYDSSLAKLLRQRELDRQLAKSGGKKPSQDEEENPFEVE